MGFFECINDKQAAHQLFDACKTWLQQHGMEAMDGPINFGDREQWWGLLVDGFTPPNYAMPYNSLYYKELFESYGFQNYFNQYTYRRDFSRDGIKPEILEKANRVFQNPDYQLFAEEVWEEVAFGVRLLGLSLPPAGYWDWERLTGTTRWPADPFFTNYGVGRTNDLYAPNYEVASAVVTSEDYDCFCIQGLGPNRTDDFSGNDGWPNGGRVQLYDPTNGTVSYGDIYRFGGQYKVGNWYVNTATDNANFHWRRWSIPEQP